MVAEEGFNGHGAGSQEPACVAHLGRCRAVRQVALGDDQFGAPFHCLVDGSPKGADGVGLPTGGAGTRRPFQGVMDPSQDPEMGLTYVDVAHGGEPAQRAGLASATVRPGSGRRRSRWPPRRRLSRGTARL